MGVVHVCAAALLVAALLAATGCTSAGQVPTATSAVVHDTWPGCKALGAFITDDEAPEFVGRGRLPADFRATTALRCQVVENAAPDGSTVRLGLERRATDIGELLWSLSRPDPLPGPTPMGCDSDGWIVPWLVLFDHAGRWVAPTIPVDLCGKPDGWRTERGPAYQRLAFTDTVVQTQGAAETAAVQKSRCDFGQRNVAAAQGHGRVLFGRLTTSPIGGSNLHFCVFAGPRASAEDDRPIGSFVRGGVISGADRDAVVAALVPSPPASPCTRWSSRFMTIISVAGGPYFVVELDGCQRVMFGYNPYLAGSRGTFAQASPALIKLLEAA